MINNLLLVLAYNEAVNIKKTIYELIDEFDKIIVINDASKDSTQEILDQIQNEHNKVSIIKNKKNFGAGKSFQIGLNYIVEKKLDPINIVKIDGDGQFKRFDILKVKKILERNNVDYVKANRFWSDGIVGDIPNIRYFGNSIASFLIKFNTGLFKINDPLNGLLGFKAKFIKHINVPKIFFRYGYPFYVNSSFVQNNLKTYEIQNVVKYGIGEKSQLKALPIFLKLFGYSVFYFFANIRSKLKISDLQISAILDITFTCFQLFSFISLSILMSIRYFERSGVQSNWFILFVLFQLFSFLNIYYSKSLENNVRKSMFTNY